MVRSFNPSTGADPYHSLLVADLGDVHVNLYDLKDSCRQIQEAFRKIVAGGCVPLTLGKPSGCRETGPVCATRGPSTSPSIP